MSNPDEDTTKFSLPSMPGTRPPTPACLDHPLRSVRISRSIWPMDSGDTIPRLTCPIRSPIMLPQVYLQLVNG